ncbi:MAG TPA: replication-associated recombination protein A [Candidatus Acidoferrales bacterium]|nr:replication-associated recombination protein A [Candidatus Acidoferrales bacterium]
MSLFRAIEPQEDEPQGSRPLADRMRPRTLDEVMGQENLLAHGKPLRTQIERDQIVSMLLWGPPGCGKTTLARLIAKTTRSEFVPFSAVMSGIKEIKQVMAAAEGARRYGRRTVVFVDEIHRFNKAQQDAFLPYVEAGTILLIGATTENPSFEVIAPLLSRMKVYVLEALSSDQILSLLHRALADKKYGLGNENLEIPSEVLDRIAQIANGDARAAYNTLEAVVLGSEPAASGKRIVTRERLDDVLQHKFLLYDKSGEEHFNLISALHKSVRNSDPDAALYWLARMLESGEDPLYLARRLVRMASEDIGLADPNALQVTLAAMNAFDFLGVPEGHLALAEAAVYLSLAPKSNAVYTAFGEVHEDLQRTIAEPVPLHLRNAVTGLMKHIGYGKGYQYAHDKEEKVADMECLPESLRGRVYYHPTDQGLEARLRQRLEEIRRIKSKRSENAGGADSPEAENHAHGASKSNKLKEANKLKDAKR